MQRFESANRPTKAVLPSSHRGLRILIVEDHADTRRGLAALMTLLGYDATFAVDMRIAIQHAAGIRFDLLVSDIGLPDGTGWELMRRLDSIGRRPAHAVAISGFNACADIERSREAGFREHLVKPFAPEMLEAVLRTVAAELTVLQVVPA